MLIDANIFISGVISPRGRPALVLERAIAGAFTLLSTADLEEEVARGMARLAADPRFSLPASAQQAVLVALANATRIETDQPPPLRCRDPKDDYLLACALAGGAHYLVSGDADLLALDGQPALGALRIVSAAAFLAVLSDPPSNA